MDAGGGRRPPRAPRRRRAVRPRRPGPQQHCDVCSGGHCRSAAGCIHAAGCGCTGSGHWGWLCRLCLRKAGHQLCWWRRAAGPHTSGSGRIAALEQHLPPPPAVRTGTVLRSPTHCLPRPHLCCALHILTKRAAISSRNEYQGAARPAAPCTPSCAQPRRRPQLAPLSGEPTLLHCWGARAPAPPLHKTRL